MKYKEYQLSEQMCNNQKLPGTKDMFYIYIHIYVCLSMMI